MARGRVAAGDGWAPDRGEEPDLTPPRPPAYADDASDLCYVKDCGRAIALLMARAEQLNHRIYNVSSGRLVRYREVVDAIHATVPGANITLPEGRSPNRPHNYLDITRLRADTGFRPQYDVEHAVPHYADWLERHDR